MKKVFIGLLIVAACAGAYYFLQNKNTTAVRPFDKNLLTGKWQLDPASSVKDSASVFKQGMTLPKDSSIRQCHYEFHKEGTLVRALNDSVKASTMYYEWDEHNALRIKASAKDSSGETYRINKLVPDSLILQTKDSAVFVFTKLR